MPGHIPERASTGHQALFWECGQSFFYEAQRAPHSSSPPASCLRCIGSGSPGPSKGGCSSTGTPRPGVLCCAKQPASPNRWQSGIAIHHRRKWPTPLPGPQTNGSTPPSLPQPHQLPPLPGSGAEPFTQRVLCVECWGRQGWALCGVTSIITESQ